MKQTAIAYCKAGENCSRALLRAASDRYGFPLSAELLQSCNALRAGFGVGGICSALVAAVMVLGILFEEKEAQQKSLQFFCRIQEGWCCLDCCRLSATLIDCSELIGAFAEILEEIIEEK